MAKFKALVEVGGAGMEEAVEGVYAGQQGYGVMIRRLELLYGGKDQQMVARAAAIKECKIVQAGKLRDMQMLVDAVTKYEASLPPERVHEACSVQHAVTVVHKLSEELQLLYRQYCTSIGVEDEYNVPLLMRWLRDHLRHLYKRKDTAKSPAPKKSGGSSGSSGAAAAAAAKHKAVFLVGDQQMELIPVGSGSGSTAAGATTTKVAKSMSAAECCWYCQDKHHLADCPDFKDKLAATRKALVHGADLCAVYLP